MTDFSKYGTPFVPGQAPIGAGPAPTTDFSKYGTPMGTPAAPAPSPSLLGDLARSIPDQFQQGVSQVTQGAKEITNGGSPLQGAESGLRIESGIASILTSPLAPLFYPVSKAVGAVANAVSDAPAVQQFAQSPAGMGTARVAEDLANAGNVAGTIAGAAKGAQEAPTAVGMAEKAGTDLAATAEKVLPTPSTPDAVLLDSYNKAIKPLMSGKTAPGQLAKYNESVVSAIKSIAENRTNLQFTDETGNTIQGELPQTRGELADALTQTKRVLFNQYNDMTRRATGQDAQVPLDAAGQALHDVINSEALQIANPSAVQFAKSVLGNLQNPDGSFKAVSPLVAEQVIENLNTKLKAFYKNPSYDSASNAAIEAGVATELRRALDQTIENADGPGYAELKRQYGALSAIEKDVNKAAIMQSKHTSTNASGLGKYVDVFAGGDMVSGLLSLHPGMFARGAAQAGINHFFQWYNSPDRAIGQMFKATKSAPAATPTGGAPTDYGVYAPTGAGAASVPQSQP